MKPAGCLQSDLSAGWLVVDVGTVVLSAALGAGAGGIVSLGAAAQIAFLSERGRARAQVRAQVLERVREERARVLAAWTGSALPTQRVATRRRRPNALRMTCCPQAPVSPVASTRRSRVP